MRIKSAAHAGNIVKRGKVKDTLKKVSGKYSTGPILLGFLVFVVVGSGNGFLPFHCVAIFQIFKAHLF